MFRHRLDRVGCAVSGLGKAGPSGVKTSVLLMGPARPPGAVKVPLLDVGLSDLGGPATRLGTACAELSGAAR